MFMALVLCFNASWMLDNALNFARLIFTCSYVQNLQSTINQPALCGNCLRMYLR